MQFTPGQLVVHPHHGPSTVTGLRDRTLQGAPTRYVELRVHRSDLSIALPEARAGDIGVRAVYGSEQVARLLEVLQAPSGPREPQWARRIKANHERLLRGDLLETACVVRDLTRREAELGTAEKDMLKKSRRPLLGELVESLHLSDEGAERLLEAAVHGEDLTGVCPHPLAS